MHCCWSCSVQGGHGGASHTATAQPSVPPSRGGHSGGLSHRHRRRHSAQCSSFREGGAAGASYTAVTQPSIPLSRGDAAEASHTASATHPSPVRSRVPESRGRQAVTVQSSRSSASLHCSTALISITASLNG